MQKELICLFIPFILGYGMTEVGLTHYNTKDLFRHNSVGKLLELTEMKVKPISLNFNRRKTTS